MTDIAVSDNSLDLQFLVLHGHRRAYRRTGTGPALLLLHGLGRDSSTWLPVLPALAQEFTVIAPDLLGHGASDKPRADYSIGGYANGMRDLLTVLGIDKATVMGHSFGVGVAMQFAYQFPGRTERLVLVAPGGMSSEISVLLRGLTLPGAGVALAAAGVAPLRPFVRTGLRALSRSGLPHLRDLDEVAESYTLMCDPSAREAVRTAARHVVDWRGQIVTMTDRAYLTRLMPICVVWGADDRVIPSHHARIVARYAPGAEVHVIEGSGHFPHKDHSALFTRTVLDFVAGTAPASYHRGRWRGLMRAGDVSTLRPVSTEGSGRVAAGAIIEWTHDVRSGCPGQDGGVDPVDTLHRIGYLLERARDDTRRVQAYRRAARVLAELDPAEVERLSRAGRLTELEHIGPKTAAVAREALTGGSSYLADLEAAVEPLATDGTDVRRALRGDLHLHSDWSDGGSPITEMARAARDLGHAYVVLTDHSPRLKVANGLTADRLREQLDVVAALNESLRPFRILTGIEVDILDDGSLDQEPGLLDQLDIVVASVHSKLAMEREAMTRRMVIAVSNPRVDVLGHCTGRLVEGARGTRAQSRFDADVVFAACARFGTAVEINSRPERRDPPGELIELALQRDCIFTIDTDAHAPGQLEFQAYGAERAHAHGVPVDRIVNTKDASALLDWSATRRGGA